MVLPTREVADTIGPIVERLRRSTGWSTRCWWWTRRRGTGRPRSPAALGAEVHQEAELLPEFGRVLGQGRRDVAGARRWPSGELIVYLDSDTREFSRHFATGMLGPLI